jgi:hypothetical protein
LDILKKRLNQEIEDRRSVGLGACEAPVRLGITL